MDDGWAERNADGLLVVLLPYVLVGIPLNLYLYHDVIDKRWRTVRGIFAFCVVYGTLAASSLGLLVWYATVQFYAEDFKEFGAAVLSCTLALYGLYLCARQVAILVFYRRCLRSRAYAIKQEYVRGDRPTLKSKRFFPGRRSSKGGPSYDKLASVFLDDNYPGEGPRVTWLSWNPEVRDWPEMVVRAGLWIRLAIIPSKLSFYSALRPPLDPGSIITTTESIGLWTVSSLKLAFLHPQHEDPARSWKDAVPLKEFENCVKGKEGTFGRWHKGLSLAPASEWSQALSELPSGWIEGLDTPDVAWEVFLALALHTSAPEWTATSPVTSEDIQKRVEDCVRETLFQHHGHITTNVLMGAFPDSDPEALEWIKRVMTCSDESFRLAALMKRKQGLAGMTLCVGVDLVVALALRLGVTPGSLKFSPRQNWGGLHDVLTSRRNHVLLQLENKAELLLKSSLARYELKLGRHQPSCDLAQATYSLGALLIGKEMTAEGKGLCDKACSIWENSGDHIEIAKGLSKKAELLMRLMPVNTMATEDIQQVEHLLTSARKSAPDDVKTVCKIAELLMKQGENDKAQQLWKHCLDVCENAPTDEHQNIVQILKNLASVMQAKGKFTEAELSFARAVDTSERAFGNYHPEVADGLNKQARVSKILHDLKKAERLHRRALDIDLTAYGHRHRVVGRDFVSCADILRDQGEYQKADVFYQQAIDVGETSEAMGPRDPELATWYQSRGILLKIEGKYPDATALFQRSLSIRKGFFGVPHPDVAESLDKLAELEEITGSFDKAKRLYEEAQAIRKEALGPDHLDFLRHSAEMFKKEGELDNAGALYEQIQSIHEEKLGRRHPEVATALTERAGVLAKKGEHIEADDLYEQALEIDKHAFGDNHPTVARDLCSQAMVRISQERYSDADAQFQRSLTIRKNALGQAHPEVARTLKFWADSLLFQRKDDEATEKHKQAVKIMEGVMGPEHDDTFNQEGWLDREVLKIAAGGLLSHDMPWYEVLGLQNVAFSGDNIQAVEFLEHHVNDGPLAEGTERILAPALGAFKSVVHAAKEATGAGEDDVVQLVELCLGISRYVLGAASVGNFDRIRQVLGTITDGINTAQRSINGYNARMQCFHGLVFNLKYRRSLAIHKRKLAALLDSLMDDTSFLQKAGQLAREIADGQALVLAELAAVPLDCPHLPPAFVERTQLAKDVVESLLDPGRPSSDPRGLLGLAGGGKTVLAASVVRDTRIRKSFKHGVLWVRVGRGGKDNIGGILEGLARRLGPALSLPRQTSADVRNTTTEVGGHLQKAIADGALRCLVVLDDVWHVDVVKAVTSKGFYVLVTSRVQEVVSRGLGVDVVSDDDALEILRKSSGAYGAWPSETALQVADECDLLPLSLALAGSSVKGNPREAASWQRLLQNLRNSPDKIRRGALFFSINESIAALDEPLQHQLLLLGVMAPGVSASPQMLANLWNTDVGHAESTAATLARRFLLQKEEAAYHVHDVVLDFLQLQLEQDGVAEGLASSRQARYLAKTSVLKEYSDRVQGEYHLVSLWNSIKLDRSVNVADCYDKNLNGITDPDLWRRAGKLLALLGLYSSAEGMLQNALKLAETSGTDKRAIAGTLSDIGSVVASQGKYEEASQQYRKSQGILEQELGADDPDVAECINNLAGLLKMQGKYGEAALLYEKEEMILKTVKGSEDLDRARSRNSLAELYEKQGKFEDAELFYERALNVREASLGRHHPQVASSLSNLAGLLYAQGKYAEAEPLYERSQAIQEKVLGPEHPDVATTLNNRAELLRAQGKYDEADPLYARVLQILAATVGEEHPNYASALNNRAELLRDQGKYAEADSLYKRSQDIREKMLGPEHPDVAATLNNRAGLLCAQGKYAEAEPLYERSQAIQEKVLDPEHPDVATTLNNRAELMEILGKYEQAIPLHVRANKIWEAALGPDHPDVAAGLSNWAKLLRAQGKYAEADHLYLRAIKIGEKTLGPDHPALATRLNNRAELLTMQGKYEEAKPLYRRSLAIDERVHGPDHPEVATDLNNWAKLLRDQGEYAEAELFYERCQRIWERVLGPEHPRLAATLNNRAELLIDQGKHTEAVELLEKALTIRSTKLGEDHPHTMNTRTLLQQVRAMGSAASSGSSAEPSDDDTSSATGGVEEVKAMYK